MKCTSCKTRLPLPGKKTCQRCLDKAKHNRIQRQAKARENMVCIRCGQPLDDIRYMACSSCRQSDKLKGRKTWAQRKQQGLCTRCGKHPPTDFSSLCQSCYTRKQTERLNREDRRASEALCKLCGKRPPVRLGQCQICLDRASTNHRNLRLSRKAAGVCVVCGERPPLKDRTACKTCSPILRRNGLNHYIGNQDRSKILSRDNNRCQLCNKTTSLVIHHKDGSGKKDSPNHAFENLIVLCRPCHSSLHLVSMFCTNSKLFFELYHLLTQAAVS